MISSGEQRWRPLCRFILSIGLAAIGGAALWTLVPDQLSVSSDIVGYGIFADFDIYRYAYGYYFIALLLPLAAIALYQIMAWKGPLRYRGSARSTLFPLSTLIDAGADDNVAGPGQSFDRGSGALSLARLGSSSSSEPRSPEPVKMVKLETRIGMLWTVARILLPAATITIELSVCQVLNHRVATWIGLLGGLIYVGAVMSLAVAFRLSSSRGSHSPPPLASTTWRIALARANSLLAIAVVALLYFVSRSTAVAIGPEHHIVRYPWLPWWLAVAMTMACMIVWLSCDRRARSGADLQQVEARMLTWIVGPTLLFLVLASFPGAIGPYQGFDDAQFLAAPQLIFQHGLFPWRDIYVLHGLLADVFDGKLGMLLFGNTRWGSNAGLYLIVYPVNWIVLYGFTAYFCRKNRLILIGLSLAIVCGLVQGNAPRFLLLPIFLVAFDLVLRRATWRRCWIFIALLLVGVILTPEEALFAPCLLIVLVVFEWTGHERGQPFRSSFPRTLRCALGGLVLVVAWFAFLASTGSLSAFIEYFRVFSSGHILEGGIPTQWVFNKQLMVTFAWILPTLLWLATVWRVVAKLRMRRVWSVSDWVMVAAAAFTVLYIPKALDRADIGHVFETFSVAVPLLVLWSVELLRIADHHIRTAIRRLPANLRFPQLQHVATFGAVMAIVAGITIQKATVPSVIAQIPSAFHPVIPNNALTAMPRLGYTVPESVDTAQIRELGLMLDRYAGPTAPVFDYSNEPGVAYYLLNRVPGTRYYYSAVAQTQLAQQQEISDLQKSRPPVVIFSNTTFGLLSYDSIPQALRSYLVSEYLYAHYRPLLDVQGQLLFLRNDLFASAPPVPSGLTTTGLYFDTPACTFGDIPNYFALPTDIASRPRVQVPVTKNTSFTTTITGWAVDAATKVPTTQILAVVNGHVVPTYAIVQARPDVAQALNSPSALDSGYTMTLSVPSAGSVELFALNPDGSVSPLAPTPGTDSGTIGRTSLTTVVTQDGRTHPVVDGSAIGSVDSAARVRGELLTLDLPPGISSTSYSWLELNTPAAFGTSSFTVTDAPGTSPGHFIQFNTLSRVGSQVYVGVGNCLQWHGYGPARQLYLQRSGGDPAPTISVALVK